MNPRQPQATPDRANRPHRPVALLVVLGLALVAAGGLAGWAIFSETPPSPLAPAPTGGTVAVGQEGFDDARTVNLSVTAGPEAHLQAARGGRLTSWACTVGGTADSGGSSLSLDGVPLVNLATVTPLWRDLTAGNSGPDVTGLGAELGRLGRLEGEPPTQVNAALIAAFRDAAHAVGVANADLPGGTIPASLVAWLPAPSVTWASCDAALGDTVAPGQTLASFSRPVAGAFLNPLPADVAAGERTLTVEGHDLPVAADGTITDPAALADMASWLSVRQALAPGGSGGLTGRYKLTQPITVGVVPAVAVVAAPDGSACLIGDGQPVAATVVGSQLGQVFVQFAGATPARVDVAPPRDLTC